MRSRLSFANVVSVLALFVALGGSSYAAVQIKSGQIANNTIQSKDIKNNSVSSGDVKNRSLVGKDFKRGQLPAGPSGPQGPQGPQGVAGKTGLANVVVRTETATAPQSTSFNTSEAVPCRAGERAVGGGVTFRNSQGQEEGANSNRIVNYSHPSTFVLTAERAASDGETPNGWETGVTLTGNPNGQRIVYYAVCASD